MITLNRIAAAGLAAATFALAPSVRAGSLTLFDTSGTVTPDGLLFEVSNGTFSGTALFSQEGEYLTRHSSRRRGST